MALLDNLKSFCCKRNDGKPVKALLWTGMEVLSGQKGVSGTHLKPALVLTMKATTSEGPKFGLNLSFVFRAAPGQVTLIFEIGQVDQLFSV